MIGLFNYQFFLGGLIGLGLLRRLQIVLAAEQGRRYDLVRRGYSENHEQRISVLILFLNAEDYSPLIALLRALAEQQYPTSKVTIHLVASSESRPLLMPQMLRYNVRVWEYPVQAPTEEQARAWLIDRCLAQGGSSLFVFLRPTDMLKPEFFRHLVARSLDSFVIQGYLALKNQPKTLFDKASALSGRLFNRIDNAGRHHLGFSVRLLDSGWAVKQDVLEMLPYQRGQDFDNLEYSIRLALENFKITWAPNAVVYGESHTPFWERSCLEVATLLNRLRLLTVYGPRLLTLSLLRFNVNCLSALVAIIRPPVLTTTFGLILLALFSSDMPGLRHHQSLWWTLAFATVIVQGLACLVARCRVTDFVTLAIHTPLAYAGGLLGLPLGTFLIIKESLQRRAEFGTERYRRVQNTRFNEDLPSSDSGSLPAAGHLRFSESESQSEEEAFLAGDIPTYGRGLPEDSSSPPNDLLRTGEREFNRLLPLSNGQRQVECLLKTRITTNTDGQDSYRLILEYKSVAFSTASYRILDQAFYELHAKLASKGLTPIACGSCGYFYNPTADQPGALNTSGVCLQGKLGREVSLTADAVNVVSEACEHHTPLDRREQIVSHWKDSLLYSISPKV
jgi:hypothetical protein